MGTRGSSEAKIGTSVVLALATLLLCSSVSADDGRVRVESASHGVSLRYYSNVPFEPRKVSSLRPGQQLRCEGRCVLAMAHGVKVELSQGAVVRSSSPLFVKLPNEERARRCLVFDVLDGEIAVTRPKVDAAPLLLQVSGHQLALDRGRIRLRAKPAGLGALVDSGRAWVRTDTWTALRPGRSYSVADGVVEERQAVVQPRWSPSSEEDRPMTLAASGSGRAPSVAWAPVAGAARYHVEASTTSSFEEVLAPAVVEAPSTHVTLPLESGRHFVRVFAVDVEGFRSEASVVRQAGAVRVSLPPGGVLTTTGRMRLPAGTKVRLHQHEALELGLSHKTFIAAPRELTAAEDGYRVVLRFANDPHARAGFVLEQFALSVHFAMTPQQPIWPWDDITIRASFHTEGGVLDLAALDPRFAVFVSGRPIEARWQRSGDGFVAKVARRFVERPVLMSVVATRGSGGTLGRSFLEILGASHAAVVADHRVRHLAR